ncbi:MAG: hypothetical protein OEL81_02425 [Nitrosopumilus sp.]|nr:hypothetical protein [Nitrosopumilus sp.]
MVVDNTEKLCCPLNISSDIDQNDDPKIYDITESNLDIPSGLPDFCFQITNVKIEFYPANCLVLPFELNSEFHDGSMAFHVQMCMGISCPDNNNSTYYQTDKKLECFHLNVLGICSIEERKKDNDPIKFVIDKIEIPEIKGNQFETIIKCYVNYYMKSIFLRQINEAIDQFLRKSSPQEDEFQFFNFLSLGYDVNIGEMRIGIPSLPEENPRIKRNQFESFISMDGLSPVTQTFLYNNEEDEDAEETPTGIPGDSMTSSEMPENKIEQISISTEVGRVRERQHDLTTEISANFLDDTIRTFLEGFTFDVNLKKTIGEEDNVHITYTLSGQARLRPDPNLSHDELLIELGNKSREHIIEHIIRLNSLQLEWNNLTLTEEVWMPGISPTIPMINNVELTEIVNWFTLKSPPIEFIIKTYYVEIDTESGGSNKWRIVMAPQLNFKPAFSLLENRWNDGLEEWRSWVSQRAYIVQEGFDKWSKDVAESRVEEESIDDDDYWERVKRDAKEIWNGLIIGFTEFIDGLRNAVNEGEVFLRTCLEAIKMPDDENLPDWLKNLINNYLMLEAHINKMILKFFIDKGLYFQIDDPIEIHPEKMIGDVNLPIKLPIYKTPVSIPIQYVGIKTDNNKLIFNADLGNSTH